MTRALSLLTLTLLGAGCQTPALLDRADAQAGPARPDAAPPDAGVDVAPPDAGFACEPGAAACDGRTHYVCGADGASREDEVVCEAGCDPEAGCVACTPGSRVCDGSVSLVCNADGTGWLHGRDCAEWGVACVGAYCDDPCAQAEATRSYMGCEYYAVPLAQTRELYERIFDFRVVVANPSPRPVEVTVHRGSRIEARRRIVPGGTVDIPLPWIDGVSFPNGEHWDHSSVVADGAYRITSDFPVIVSQYSPFDYAVYQDALYYSHTNDASLLLPTHALGLEHVATSYEPVSGPLGSLPGYLAVVGVAPEGTRVRVVPTAPIAADPEGRWPETPAGEPLAFELAAGEVAQLVAAPPPSCDESRPGWIEETRFCREEGYDVTGSRVIADRPVAAFSGHVCAYVPWDTPACDHLETQLAPLTTWGTELETTVMREPGSEATNLLRVMAARDGTRVTFDPPIGEVATAELDAGAHVELPLADAVSIRADAPIQVAQMLLGQNQTDPPLERGDPSLTVLVPAEQFRDDYVFVTPSSYADAEDGRSYLLVSRAPGAAIELDGEPLEAEWTAVGERELAVVPVTGGTHRASAPAPFGLIAFGLGSYTSYAHPAGLDLHVLF
jgi:hypothetical protein